MINTRKTGFKKAWQEHDYQTIIHMAGKITNKILKDDSEFPVWCGHVRTQKGRLTRCV